MDKYPTYHQTHEVSQTQQRDTTLIKSEDSLHSYRSSTGNNRRGCYKRRMTTQTWEKVSESQIDDGHQWRKYGQKAILNSKYSRAYYRCTYKYDQRCQATKQVQRIQEEPPLYRTTYYDHHTCKSLLNPSPPHTSILISFNNTFPTPTKQECPFLSSCFPSSFVNKECKEPTFGNSSRHVTLSSTLEYDHRDVMSDILYDSVELDNIFQHLLDFNNQGMF